MKSQKNMINQFIDDHDNYFIILLDACRYDFYSKFRNCNEVKSSGKNTPNWYNNTFYKDNYDITIIGEKRAILRNNSSNILNKFDGFIDVMNKDRKLPLLINEVSKKAIENQNKNLLLHYFKPHCPYYWKFPGHYQEGRHVKVLDKEYNTPEYIGKELGKREIINLYEKNILYIIQEYERVIKNTNKKYYLITSDHGETMGEDGSFGHSHPSGHEILRKVPWRIEKR